MSVGAVIAGGKDLVIAICAVVTASVAWRGLSKWQAELAGKANFDTARSLCISAFKVRNAVRSARSPMMLSSEYPADYPRGPNIPWEERGRGLAHVYNNRWKPVQDALDVFMASGLEAEALWGEDARQAVEQYWKEVRELMFAMQATVRNAYAENEDFEHNKEFAKQMHDILWDGIDTQNPERYQLRLDKAISAVEDLVRSKLRKHEDL